MKGYVCKACHLGFLADKRMYSPFDSQDNQECPFCHVVNPGFDVYDVGEYRSSVLSAQEVREWNEIKP